MSSEAEAIAAVRKIKEAGLWGVKFYTSMDPAWIAPAAAEAHRLGLHVHGHIPRTCGRSTRFTPAMTRSRTSTSSMMQAMPQEVVDQRQHRRSGSRARQNSGKDVDLNAEPIRRLHRRIRQAARRSSIRRWWCVETV